VSASDQEILAREYSTSERLEHRRHNVTGWLRGDETWSVAEKTA
jgi:hypothetical protein